MALCNKHTVTRSNITRAGITQSGLLYPHMGGEEWVFVPQESSVFMPGSVDYYFTDLTNDHVGMGPSFSLMRSFRVDNDIDDKFCLFKAEPSDLSSENTVYIGFDTSTDYLTAVILDSVGNFMKIYGYAIAGWVGNWLHLVLTWDDPNNLFKMYINGLEVVMDVVLDEIPASNGGVGTVVLNNTSRMLTFPCPPDYGFWHEITDYQCAIWSNPLTAAEVLAIYNDNAQSTVDLRTNVGNYISSTTLQHWYRFGLDPANLGRDYVDTNRRDVPAITLDAGDVVAEYPQAPV